MRFSNALFGVRDVIQRHQTVITSGGAVWIGKIGRGLSTNRLHQIEKQILDDQETYLLLVNRDDTGYEAWIAPVHGAKSTTPTDEMRLVPQYYLDLGLCDQMHAWFKVTSIDPLPTIRLKDWRVRSSKKPLDESLGWSMSGFFLIEPARSSPTRH